jgi:hypothetical protein
MANRLTGQYVTVNMTEAVFDAVDPGVHHIMVISVRNVSMRGQRVRLVPPREPEFTLTMQNDVDLAPGLEMNAELAYYSEEPRDLESILYVLVGRADNAIAAAGGEQLLQLTGRPKDAPGQGEQLLIPVKATLPGAKIAFDQPVDFGVVTPGRGDHVVTEKRELVVRNTGSKDGKMAIAAPPAGHKISLVPLEVTVAAGGTATFAVELKCEGEVGPVRAASPARRIMCLRTTRAPHERSLLCAAVLTSAGCHTLTASRHACASCNSSCR